MLSTIILEINYEYHVVDNIFVRSGEHDSTDVSVRNNAVQPPWRVWYSTPTVRHRRNLSVQRLRTRRIIRYTHRIQTATYIGVIIMMRNSAVE